MSAAGHGDPVPEPIRMEFLFDYYLELTAHKTVPHDFGVTPMGHRIVGGVTGGWIDGPNVKARILEGIDYGIVRADDISVPDVRLVARTDDDALILMTYTGGCLGPWSEVMEVRNGKAWDPDVIDWLVTYSFETGAEKYAWLNHTLAVGRGIVTDAGFRYRVYALL